MLMLIKYKVDHMLRCNQATISKDLQEAEKICQDPARGNDGSYKAVEDLTKSVGLASIGTWNVNCFCSSPLYYNMSFMALNISAPGKFV
jgi:hypothetical protein